MNLYAYFDKVSKCYFEAFISHSDGQAVRDTLPAVSRVHPVSDIELYQLGSFVENNCLSPVSLSEKPVLVPFDSYHFDEKTAEYISKTEALERIELYRKTQALQLERAQAELDKARKELNN